MKSFFAVLVLACTLCSTAFAQFVTIPDANFVTWLQTNYPACMSGNQMDTTCAAIATAQNINLSNKAIADLSGIEHFTDLRLLNCDFNNLTTVPPIPPTLIHFRASNNQITSVTAPLPPGLIFLSLHTNPLSTLPSLPTTLESLYIGNCPGIVLPTLPPSLKLLDIQDNNYTLLPTLPSGLTTLICSDNPLGNIPSLPPVLETFSAHNIQMSTLPPLPSTLTHLQASTNSITTLPPALPGGLVEILISDNQLTALPPLPAGLNILRVGNNQLTVLPALPSTITWIECYTNQLSSLPALPSSLGMLSAQNNLLTSLSTLPPTTASVDVSNNQITCFSPFPQGSSLNLYAVNNPFTCIPNYPAYMTPLIGTIPICTTGNVMGCAVGEGIGGTVFDDLNADCSRNGVDPAVPNVPVKIYDGSGTFVQGGTSYGSGAYFFTQGLGSWAARIDTTGKPYTVTCAQPGLDSAVVLSIGTELVQGVDFEVDCKPGFDVGANAVGINGWVFPGQPFAAQVLAGDLSNFYGLHCAAGVSGQVTVTYSGPVNFTGALPGALTPVVSGNTFTYAIADFGLVNAYVDFGLGFTTQTTATAADTVCFDVTVTPTSGDQHPGNNTYSICIPVVNSLDPNAKDVYPTVVEPNYADWLNYTIHFQNTGNAPAFNIRLEDTLDANLDLESLEMLAASHYQTWNLTGNHLTVHFPNIMLPDSMSDPSGSMGWFMFRVKPKSGLGVGTVIPNSVAIYFDFNAPVITNIATTSYEVTTGTEEGILTEHEIMVYPNPSTGQFTVNYPADWKRAEWTVTNLMGQELQHTKALGGGFSVDLRAHPAGVYLLKVSDGQREYVLRILKQ